MNKAEWIFDETKSVGVDYFNEDLVKQYDNEHEKFRTFDDEANKIAHAIGLTKESLLLDIGCGTGGLTTRFASMCSRVYAVDSSPAMLNILKSKIEHQNLSNVSLIQAGLLSYEHNGDKLDAVVANLCLHHLPDFWKQIALNKLNSYIKPGGKLFICDVVFSFNPDEYVSAINEWIDEMRAMAGNQMADETLLHVKDEYSTWDWIMSGMLERAGFCIDNNSEIMRNMRIYICTKIEAL
ncbi:MAG: class I SAM-dependent methyltransferase [Pseudomonadota bacterium]|nr:class I SAM-dependent methyltransferase [Pseudomonadota bacterium]